VIYQFFILLVAFINTYKYEENELVCEERGAINTLSMEKLDAESESRKEQRLVLILEMKSITEHPWPFNHVFPDFKPGKRFLMWSRRCILQFVVVKPLVSVVAVVCALFEVYGDGEILRFDRAYVYKTIFENISITMAMYFLVLFYQVTKTELKPFKPIPKFLCIKAVIFFFVLAGSSDCDFSMDWVFPRHCKFQQKGHRYRSARFHHLHRNVSDCTRARLRVRVLHVSKIKHLFPHRERTFARRISSARIETNRKKF